MTRPLALLAFALAAGAASAQTLDDLNPSAPDLQTLTVRMEDGSAVYDLDGQGDALSFDIALGGVVVLVAGDVPFAMVTVRSRLGLDPTDGPDVVVAGRDIGPAALRISSDPEHEQSYVPFAVFACAEADEDGQVCLGWKRAVPRGSTPEDLLYNRFRIVGELPELGAPPPAPYIEDPPVGEIDPRR